MSNLRRLGFLLALVTFYFSAGATAGVILWDNDIVPDGFSEGASNLTALVRIQTPFFAGYSHESESLI